jgi:hypothetical protein
LTRVLPGRLPCGKIAPLKSGPGMRKPAYFSKFFNVLRAIYGARQKPAQLAREAIRQMREWRNW